MKNALLICSLVAGFITAQAQTLVTIDSDKYDVEEFKRMYEKSNTEGDELYSKKSVDEYVDLYVNYKLKLKEADELGLNEDPEILREIATYEEQLIRSEFDKNVMNDLLAEAKERLNEEICMRHILIDIPSRYVGTEDTIYSYNKAVSVRKKFIDGANWDELVKKNSSDMDTKYTGGNLGCFTTLQLSSYELENQAYKMKKGQISDPIRTRFGYHIIHIIDRRPNNGMVSATQLFIRANNTLSTEEQAEAKEVIYDAYDQLRDDVKFEDVGRWMKTRLPNYVTIDKIDEFTVGTYDSDFENEIFELEEVGEYSKPFQSELGWHIFRLDSKENLPDFEELEPAIRDRITEDERFNNAREKFSSQLKSKYKFKKNEQVVNQFQRQVAPGISVPGWQLPSGFDYSDDFFTIEDTHYTANQFVEFVLNQHHIDRYRTFETYYNNFETNMLIDYHKHHLSKSDPEMKSLLQEYHDGIVLFNLMEQEVWDKQEISDSELKSYYNKHKDKYKTEDLVNVDVYTTSNSRIASKIRKSMSNKFNLGGLVGGLDKFVKKYPKEIKTSTIQFTQKDAEINGENLWKLNTIARQENEQGEYIFLVSDSIEKGKPLPFEDVKAQVRSDYQSVYEEEWIEKLKEKYKVSINNTVVESLYR